MNGWTADTDHDALSPWSYPASPRHESMEGHPAGGLRGAMYALALASPFWALVGGIVWWLR